MTEVFVFGSNRAGRHGKGAAEYARLACGAKPGVGFGPTGKAWAIPTKDEQLRTLPLDAVLSGIRSFMEDASAHPETIYRFTRVGCGLAGLDEAAIRNFCLQHRPSNVHLPGVWLRHESPRVARVIVAGSRTFNDQSRLFRAVDRAQERLGTIEVVSGGARGADRLGEAYAAQRGVALKVFPADWDRLGKSAGYWRNQTMAWYGTHLIAFQHNASPGTGHMIRIAREGGLVVAALAVQ